MADYGFPPVFPSDEELKAKEEAEKNASKDNEPIIKVGTSSEFFN